MNGEDGQDDPLAEAVRVGLSSGQDGCARCGGRHADPLTWKRFERPPGPYRYWATCPATGDPILMEVTVEQLAIKAQGEPTR